MPRCTKFFHHKKRVFAAGGGNMINKEEFQPEQCTYSIIEYELNNINMNKFMKKALEYNA